MQRQHKTQSVRKAILKRMAGLFVCFASWANPADEHTFVGLLSRVRCDAPHRTATQCNVTQRGHHTEYDQTGRRPPLHVYYSASQPRDRRVSTNPSTRASTRTRTRARTHTHTHNHTHTHTHNHTHTTRTSTRSTGTKHQAPSAKHQQHQASPKQARDEEIDDVAVVLSTTTTTRTTTTTTTQNTSTR